MQTVSMHPGGQCFLGGSWDGAIKVWQFKDGMLLATLKTTFRTASQRGSRREL